MKVVFASTPNQEEKINELVQYFYSSIFPHYFSDEEISEFEKLKILYISNKCKQSIGTLKEAYQVIASLQTLISILDGAGPKDEYASIFSKNVEILKEFELYFPFNFENFNNSYSLYGKSGLSIYTKADNNLLV